MPLLQGDLNAAEHAYLRATLVQQSVRAPIERFLDLTTAATFPPAREAAARDVARTKSELQVARQLYVDSPAVDVPEKLRVLGKMKEMADADLKAAQTSGSQPETDAATQQVQLVDGKIARYSVPGATA